MRSKIKKFYDKYNIVIMFVCFFFFILVAFLLQMDKTSAIDNDIYHFISVIISPNMTTFFKIITSLGSFYTITAICIFSVIFFKDRRNSRLVATNALIIFIIVFILKFTFLRERPLDINLITEYGYSFPSSHSAVSVAFYGFLSYLIYHNLNNKKVRNTILSLITVLVFLIGISRIYLGVHYATDVLAGFSISGAYLILFIQLIYKRKNKRKSKEVKRNV